MISSIYRRDSCTILYSSSSVVSQQLKEGEGEKVSEGRREGERGTWDEEELIGAKQKYNKSKAE